MTDSVSRHSHTGTAAPLSCRHEAEDVAMQFRRPPPLRVAAVFQEIPRFHGSREARQNQPVILQSQPQNAASAADGVGFLGAAVRRAGADRGAARAAEPEDGVARVQGVEGRAEAAARGDAVSEVGEAVQARPRRGEGQFEEGAGFIPQRGGAWVHAGDGRRRVGLLGDGEEGGGDCLVSEGGGAR